MDDPVLVRVGDASGDSFQHPKAAFERGPPEFEVAIQGFSLDQLHHDVGTAPGFAHVVHRNQGGMGQLRGDLRLAAKPLDGGDMGIEVVPKDLERDRAIELSIESAVDYGHPTAAEFFGALVSTLSGMVGHRGLDSRNCMIPANSPRVSPLLEHGDSKSSISRFGKEMTVPSDSRVVEIRAILVACLRMALLRRRARFLEESGHHAMATLAWLAAGHVETHVRQETRRIFSGLSRAAPETAGRP